MNTVQKNNNITKKQVQELLENNQEKLRISDKNLRKLIKSIRSHTISRQMRKIFYQECLKKIERNKENEEKTRKFTHLTPEDRISIEILHTAGFNNSFIGAFVGKDRSSIKREIDKNAIEIWDINSTKSPYKEKKQINIKYYSSEKAQKNAEENKLKNRKKCKLDRYPLPCGKSFIVNPYFLAFTALYIAFVPIFVSASFIFPSLLKFAITSGM